MVATMALLAAGSAWSQDPPPSDSTRQPVSFSRDIAPIFSAKCVSCHGPEKAKGSFRLETYERMMTPGDSEEPAIVSGSPDQSLLYQLITTSDPEDRMPQKDEPLAAAQIQLVRRWIAEGANAPGAERTLPVGILTGHRQHPAPPATYGRPLPIRALAFSPDGRTLAAGGFHEVTLWDSHTGTLQARWTNLVERIHDLVYAPEGGPLLVVGGNPGRLGEARLLDTKDGHSVRLMALASDTLLTGAFSPDGSLIAVGGCDRVIRILRTGNATVLATLQHHSDWVLDLAFSTSGSHLVSASRDATARVFETAMWTMISAYRDHDQAVYGAVFARNDSMILSASGNQLHAWNADSAKKSKTSKPIGSTILSMTTDGDALWLSAADGRVVSCSMEEPGKVTRTLDGLNDAVYALAWHSPSRRLAAGAHDGRVHVWNANSGEETIRFIASPGWGPEGK